MNLRATLVAGLALGALVLTGCGGAERAASDDAGLTGGTTAELTQANFVDQVSQAQREARSAHLTMTVATGGEEVEAEGDVAISRDGASAMATTVTMPGVGEVEARLVDGVLYLNLGPLSENKFAKVDLDDPSNPLARAFRGYAEQLDPAAAVTALEGAITSFEEAGEPQEIDGVDAQPYRVTVDTAKAGAALGASPDGAAAKGAQVPESVTATFWVGEDNLPRRVESEVAGAKVRVDLSQWGEQVDVEAPAADQITERDPFSGALPSATPTP